ncbi:MAG: biotin--[acetyl-CoA-carboxylase] ligase [Treponemataceae bacterium]|nr:biotin--[acetyl-CoA-carboxylase] ligase [Treponemataceae bacterium]
MSTKELVLDFLMNESFGKAVSGEFLAEKFQVSRTAVWKAVNALRKDGIQIVGTPNGGYLFNDTDIFSEKIFATEFERAFPQYRGAKIFVFDEIDSTNSFAKRLLAEGATVSLDDAGSPVIVLAASQTAGRGRLGRTFYSPKKNGIYLSVIFAPKGGIDNPGKITAFTAVAVVRAIKKLYGIQTGIKWVNDIFAGGKKICGILTEGVTNFETGLIESAVIGIGINMRASSELPEEVSKVAGDIESALNAGAQEKAASDEPAQNSAAQKAALNAAADDTPAQKAALNAAADDAPAHDEPGRCALASQVAGNVLSILGEDYKSVMAEYKSYSILIGKTVQVHPIIDDKASAYPAKVIDIDENAALVVELPDGTQKKLSSGEVSIHSSSLNCN